MKAKARKKPVAAAKRSPRPVKAVSSVGDEALPTGVMTVTVTKFRSLGAITPLEATLSNWSGFYMPDGSPPPPPVPTLTLVDNNVIIDSEVAIRLIYNMPDPTYVLIGAAWHDESRNTVGKHTFPDVYVQRCVNIPVPYNEPVDGGSCMTVTDDADFPGDYQYVLVIQEVATGEIGFFDPGIVNKPR